MNSVKLIETFCLSLDPSRILLAQGLQPDAWQKQLLYSRDRQILLCCSRQAGKSTVVSALVLHQALFHPRSLILLLSPSQRQSGEIYRKVLDGYRAVNRWMPAKQKTEFRLELANGSRILCLPGREETIRSFGGVSLIVLDEAARIRDDLYRSIRPMLATSRGRLVALSTPFGQRGWFYDEWRTGSAFRKICIPWKECPRIDPEFIAGEVQSMGQQWVDQEYNCCFHSTEGLVYPEFSTTLVPSFPLPEGQRVGGIDFGWRNPFAALWGVLDEQDILWIRQERYVSETPLHEHRRWLQAQGRVIWYADPAGRTEIEELRAANLVVRKGDNEIRSGIAAITARIRTGRLKVSEDTCPALVREAQLYRYPTPQERSLLGENPVDQNNHALAALRYLISRLDARFLAKFRHPGNPDSPEGTVPAKPDNPTAPWLRYDNPSLWS